MLLGRLRASPLAIYCLYYNHSMNVQSQRSPFPTREGLPYPLTGVGDDTNKRQAGQHASHETLVHLQISSNTPFSSRMRCVARFLEL